MIGNLAQSGDLRSGLVWILNGQRVWLKNGIDESVFKYVLKYVYVLIPLLALT